MPKNARQIIAGVLHCYRGHPLIDDNVFARRDGRNECRLCRVEFQRTRNPNWLPDTTESIMDNYKEPLRPVKDGYGYYGTLAYDRDTQTHVQCHTCGNFYKNIGSHVSTHGTTVHEYKQLYDLPLKMYIKAPKYKTPQWIRWHSKTEEEKAEWLEMAKKGREKHEANGRNQAHYKRKSLYKKNLEGRCPDQLLDKIETMAKEMGHTPTFREFSVEYGSGFGQSVQRTFGTWTEAIKILGLAQRTGDLQARYSREALLQIMIDFKQRNGREPVYKDTRFGGQLPSGPTFSKYFGSWGEAKESAYGGK